MPRTSAKKWTDLAVRVAALDLLDASPKPLTASDVAAGIKAPVGMVRDALVHLAEKTGEASVHHREKSGDFYTTQAAACRP